MHEPVLEVGVTIAVVVEVGVRSPIAVVVETGSGRRRHVEEAELGLELLGVEPSSRRGEVQRGELEVPVLGPVRQDTQDIMQVALGLEAGGAAGADASWQW